MSFPIFLGLAAYYLGKAIQEALDENRSKNLQLTHQPKKQLNNDSFNGGRNNAVTDCYEEIESEVCDERY